VIKAVCDDWMRLYVNGQLLSDRDGGWSTVKQVTVNAITPTVLAIECFDASWSGPGLTPVNVNGILAETSNGRVTDSSWRCSNTRQTGWTTVSIAISGSRR
jgi:hypothetical protein